MFMYIYLHTHTHAPTHTSGPWRSGVLAARPRFGGGVEAPRKGARPRPS